MKRISRSMVLLFIFLIGSACGQPGALHLGMLLDIPSTKSIPANGVMAELRMYPRGGLLTTMLIGLTDRFSLGVSYGGENIIGTGKVNLNPQPCVQLRYLVMEEKFLSPAVMIGFNSQGYGGYNKDLKRYEVKSRGLYVVVSKNTSFLGGIGFHAGMNRSLEAEDGDNDLNVFGGLHKRFNLDLVLLCEYDTAINDNSGNAMGSGKGYLNSGVRWSFAQRLFVEFAWKNILENRENEAGTSREVKLVYVSHF